MSAPVAAGAALAPWWVTYPQMWTREVDELAAAGAAWAPLDREQLAEGQVAAGATPAGGLLVSWPHPAPQSGDPDRLELQAQYPRQYPWFPPTVSLTRPLAGLRRHRNPTTGTLCLLGGEQEWLPGTTLAALLYRSCRCSSRPAGPLMRIRPRWRWRPAPSRCGHGCSRPAAGC